MKVSNLLLLTNPSLASNWVLLNTSKHELLFNEPEASLLNKISCLIKAHLHWQCFYGNIAGDGNMRQAHRVYGQSLLTCRGHLGWRDINRNDPISVVPPKVAKASK